MAGEDAPVVAEGGGDVGRARRGVARLGVVEVVFEDDGWRCGKLGELRLRRWRRW